MIRTQGDGKENPEAILESRRRSVKSTSSTEDTEKLDKLGKQILSKKIQSSSSFYNPSLSSQSVVTNFPPEIKPNGKKFFLIPKLIAPRKLNLLAKPKAPKLIIMEPYKACITPMIPYPPSNNKVRKPPKINKNNLELNELVRHINITKNSCENNASSTKDSIDGDEIAQLRKERDQYESQLKFQMQVNSELKQLLLSAIGDEDTTKLSNLAEDKMKIAEHLSSNTEKIEFLAGQSEVWRSKFLASSLMVEELAKWKAVLSEKNSQLISANKRLLETIATVRDMEIELYSNLKFLSNYHETNLKTSNVVDLTAECLNISQQLVLNSGKIGMPERLTSTSLDPMTSAQKHALSAMDNSNDFLTSTDDASKAICTQATQEYQRKISQSEAFEFVDDGDAK